MDGTTGKLLDRLISVIGEEARLFEEFLGLLERQQQALIGGDTDTLPDITSRLQTIISQSQQMERARIEAVEAIRRQDGTETDLTVSRICDMADAERSVQLRHLRETVLALYSRIEETRMRNGLLIEQSLEQIQHTLQTIGRVPARPETYQQQGCCAHEYASVGVDRRV